MMSQIARQGLHFAAAILLAAPAMADAQAVFTALGHLSTPTQTMGSGATAVSGDGSTVVGTSVSTGTTLGQEAFIWRSETGMQGLGTLPGVPYSAARGVSTDGEFVVGLSRTAFRWHDGVMIDLGDLPGGNTSSSAFEVSDDGRVVFGHSSSGTLPPTTLEAFRWEDGKMVGMGSFPGDVFPTTAEGLSGDESTVVGSGRITSGQVNYRYRDGFVKSIGELAGGITEGGALAVSYNGSVVVGWGNSANGSEATRWTQARGMVGLGFLSGHVSSTAWAVSPDGWVVYGESVSPNIGGNVFRDAFIWDPINGMRKLQDVLKQDYGLDLPGWRLRQVTDCSDDGRVIVGWGFNPEGFAEAWRLEMPPFCYADCDDSTGLRTLDVLDFLCFVARFSTKDLYTDCNQDGTHDLFDFLCFINHFNAGCP